MKPCVHRFLRLLLRAALYGWFMLLVVALLDVLLFGPAWVDGLIDTAMRWWLGLFGL